MSINLRYPNITGLSEREQLAQLKSYMHQLVEQLQWAFNSMDGKSGKEAQVVVNNITPRPSTTIDGQATFDAVTIRGNKIIDFPIEEGTDGIWSYRKWHSGIAECWGLYPITGAVITTPWGSLYETAVNYQQKFPQGLFADTPVAHYFAQTSNGGGCLAVETVGETTKDQTCSLFPIRATPQTVDLTIAIRAIGRWK